MLRSLLYLVGVITFTACASAQKDYGYMATHEYQDKPLLTQSLVSASELLSEPAVQKILSSKVVLPKSIQIALVRLDNSPRGFEFQTIEKEVAEQLYNKANWGERVKSVIPMPQLMISSPVTLGSLRQAAVLLQADALVIVKPASFGDWKYRYFEDNKAKGTTTLEVVMLDTRTSVVPFTSMITETAEIKGEKSDYSNFELTTRAKKASENQALLKVAPSINKFISSVM